MCNLLCRLHYTNVAYRINALSLLNLSFNQRCLYSQDNPRYCLHPNPADVAYEVN